MTKISKAQASTMRYLYKHIGLSLPEIAESFGCCLSNVGLIIKNEIHIDNSYDPLFVPDTILRTHFQKNKRRFNCLFEEAFKPIVGYDGYVIGRDGSVFSNDGYRWRQLKYFFRDSGYPMVGLYDKNRKQHDCFIHRLLGVAFIPNPENKPFVLHNNDDKMDWRLENLKWGDSSNNRQDAIKNNRLPKTMFRIPEFTKQEVRRIKTLYPEISQIQLSKMFGVDQKSIKTILSTAN